jgi:hypothetical protein
MMNESRPAAQALYNTVIHRYLNHGIENMLHNNSSYRRQSVSEVHKLCWTLMGKVWNGLVGKDIDACVEGLPALVTVTRQNLPRL